MLRDINPRSSTPLPPEIDIICSTAPVTQMGLGDLQHGLGQGGLSQPSRNIVAQHTHPRRDRPAVIAVFAFASHKQYQTFSA